MNHIKLLNHLEDMISEEVFVTVESFEYAYETRVKSEAEFIMDEENKLLKINYIFKIKYDD